MTPSKRMLPLAACQSRLQTLLSSKAIERAGDRGIIKKSEAELFVEALESIQHRNETLLRYEPIIRSAIKAAQAEEKPGEQKHEV